MHSRWNRLWAAGTLIACLATAQAATQVTSGTLPDGTAYRIDYPDNWNGTLLVSLDYAPNGGTQAVNVELHKRGFATSGVTRNVTGWSVGDAVANHVRVHELFTQRHGRPANTYVNGSSLGGHTGAAALQARPDIFTGGLLQCAGLAGMVGSWNQKFDGLFVAKTLLVPDDPQYPVIDIPDNFATVTRPAWLSMLAQAQQTPAGKARIALAAVIAQLATWSVGSKPIPAPGDYDALQAGLYDSFAGNSLPAVGQMMSSRNELNRRSGGNISWNVGVDYDAILARVQNADVVRAMYDKAGLSLEADMARLRAAPRVTATPDAIRWGRVQVISKPLTAPVVTMTGIGDQISPTSAQQAYEAVAGSDNLRQTYVRAAGHCGFNGPETVAAVEVLHQRVTTGSWPDTSPAAMNALATTVPLSGTPRFLAHTPDVFQRPFRFFSVLASGRDQVTALRTQATIQVVLTPPQSLVPEHAAGRIVAGSVRLGGAAPLKANVVADSLILSFRVADLPGVAPGKTVSLPLSGQYVHGVPIDDTVSVTLK